MSLPSLAEVEHADWPTLTRICSDLGLNAKGRSGVVRMRVLDHVRRRVHPETWRPGASQQAALLTRLGHPDAAARLWESTIQLDEPSPWIGLGRAHLGSGDLREAAKAFDRAIQMGDAAANLHRAESLAAAGDYEAAVRACDAYLAARPHDLRGLLLKANFLARGGWINEAATVMRDGFESHADARELWRGLGSLLMKAGRFDAAAEAYHEALRADPTDPENWINRGAALLLAGRGHEAIGAFREVLESDPRQAVALNNLGVAYLREGQSKSAAVNLERAAKHMETPQVLRNLAKVQEATGQHAAAAESYARLLVLKPKDAEARGARRRLEPRRRIRPKPPRAAKARPRRKRRVGRRRPTKRRSARKRVVKKRKIRRSVKPRLRAKPRSRRAPRPRRSSKRRATHRRR